ncbi:lysine exporter protein LysE/YggA [Cupriavidus basilensis OR16]|uniref:Lysine exporter protein LysE/YggA n=1 Tax=Cupriavidus basilensis OR16 TaxID=1127483 RepID=H1S967_9BURK|nr:LysE family translocator [Cupriavidus basilensis]EHP40917.1 lysine exporter protein LysE/YggA [Cupriavidus basilensis OR16]
MVSLHLLVTFIGALAVVYALPGPDMALVLQTSTGRGIRHGLATVAGLAMARAAHVTLSACGVAALLRAAPWLYQGIRVAGGLYLAYVAIQIFRSPAFGMGSGSGTAPPVPLRACVAKGALSSILNPKALLFCSVLLPQFVDPHGAPVWSQVLELGVVLVLTGVAFDLACVFGAVRLTGWLRRSPRAQTVQRWSFSAALLAFAARISFE